MIEMFLRHERQSGRRGRRITGGRAALLVTVVAGGALLLATLAGEGGRPTDDDCVQRVKVWSPSRQAHVMRVQTFCS